MNMKEAVELLRSKGLKITNKRKDIITFFDKADGYRTAKDLLQFMEEKYQGISFDTVYRNLHLYNEIGILETTELNGEKHFRMNCTMHHHHHFICSICGKTKEIDICPMNDIKDKLEDYIIEDHKFEIYGLCPECKIA